MENSHLLNAKRDAFSPEELSLVRRAYAEQVLAFLKVDRPEYRAAFAAVSRERFLGRGPWTASLPLSGYRHLRSKDPVVLYQDLIFGIDQQRGVNNGLPSLHAQMMDALDVERGAHIVHVGCGSGYYSAILAEIVGSTGTVTAIEYDERLAILARDALADRSNVRVVCGDGANFPDQTVDGIYVNFAVSRPADRWIEQLAPKGRLVFPLGVPNNQHSSFSGRYSERGAVICVQQREDGYAASFLASAFFICGENALDSDPNSEEKLRAAFGAGGVESIRSLKWKQDFHRKKCWYVGNDWALCVE